MRHEDDLVCSQGYDAREARPIISHIARDPGLWGARLQVRLGELEEGGWRLTLACS
jgi:hypothetical protein